MSTDSDDENGTFGDMFGADETSTQAAIVDAEFVVERRAWLDEGITAAGTTPLWESNVVSPPESSGELPPLRLFQREKHHSLWGHKIWNAAKYFAKCMDTGRLDVRGKTVLELGSGLGVPSIVAHQHGARVVVVTDYPDNDLMDILAKNVDANVFPPPQVDGMDGTPYKPKLVATPLLWGKKEHIENCLELTGSGCGFDVVFLSDIVFNHVCHDDLLKTVAVCLAKDHRAAAYCAFSHHRPHKQKDDMEFFAKAAKFGLTWEKIDEEIYPLMFPDDPGPRDIREPVHCFRLRHVFDDAGPPLDLMTTYDVVVQGTGITETFLSAALSRHGMKVLHLDAAPSYGGVFNTLDPAAFTGFVRKFDDASVVIDRFQEAKCAPLQEGQQESLEVVDELRRLGAFKCRQFQLDTLPMMFLAQGDLVSTLVDSEAARNMEFQNVDRVLLMTLASDTLLLHRMPLTRSDVFASQDFSPMEMRRLMKFVKDIEARLAEKEHAVPTASDTKFVSEIDGESFADYLVRKYQLSRKTVHLLTLFGLLECSPPANSSRGCIEGSVELLRTFLTSVGRFGGSTPFLAANYGVAELPQNMCRVSAVWDGTFVLRRSVTSTFRDNKRAYVTLSNGQQLEAKAFACSASSLARTAKPSAARRLCRCVVVLRRPLFSWTDIQTQLRDEPTDEAEAAVRDVSIPLLLLAGAISSQRADDGALSDVVIDNISRSTPVQIVQQGSTTLQTPSDGMYAVVHFVCPERCVSLTDLNEYVDRVLLRKGISDADFCYRCSFVLSDTQLVSPVSVDEVDGVPQDHVFTVETLSDSLDDGVYVREAKRAFEQIVRHVSTMGVDPWSGGRCKHPDLIESGDSSDAKKANDDVPLFLPPPPEEILLQTHSVGDGDRDAELLAAATRIQNLRLEAAAPAE